MSSSQAPGYVAGKPVDADAEVETSLVTFRAQFAGMVLNATERLIGLGAPGGILL
ncbi:hypothetical protein [Bradyrhizobium sp. SZCCHNPS1003]|uniref:hypothetical protein n=1 Tax=Bradyrhizobium sp. SZCCHNPS1003 TaxID=3057330 RepID=UPI0028ED093E|nr:hypothetical protein [Bradyrhizobium sp. SZCCHNPS1003]